MRLDISPFETVTEAQTWARLEIDTAAGLARARYITIAPGQDATYQAKYADAKAFVAAGYPAANIDNYPWIKADSEHTGTTYKESADGMVAVGDPWNTVIGPTIEGTRIGGKTALDALTDVKSVVTHTRTVVAALAAI